MATKNEDIEKALSTAENAIQIRDFALAEITLKSTLELVLDTDSQYTVLLEKLAETQWYRDKLEESAKTCNELAKTWAGEGNQAGIVSTLSNLALIMHKNNKVKEAEEFYLQALQNMRILLGPKHPYVDKLNSFYAQLLTDTNRGEEASQLAVPPRQITAHDWHSLGIIRLFRKKVESEDAESSSSSKPEQSPENLTEVNLKISDVESRLIFNTNNQVCEQAILHGKLDLAERLCHFNLKLLVAFHVEGKVLAIVFEKLSEINQKRGLIEQAIEFAMKCLVIKTKEIGKDSYEAAKDHQRLAWLYFEVADYESSKNNLQNAIQIFKKCQGEESPDVACAIHNLATLYHVQKQFAPAEKMYKQSLDIKMKVFGPDHNETKGLLKSYAELLVSTGRQQDANHLETDTTGMITGSWKLDGKSAKLAGMSAEKVCKNCGSKMKLDICLVCSEKA